MNHAFNVNIATDFSVDTALFIGHIEHWTFKNLANHKNIYDGYCWSYDTLDALGDIFPYWSKRQRERVINNAVKEGLIIRGNYNQTKYDRTVWYALTPKAFEYFPHLNKPKYLQSLCLSISPNGEMEIPEWRNGVHQTVTPIPDTNPDTNPDKKLTNCKSSSSFVFSNTLDKSMLSQKLENDKRADEEFINEVKDHVTNHSDKKFAYMQRAQAALRLLKKLRTENIIFHSGGKNTAEEEMTRLEKERKADRNNFLGEYKAYRSQFINDRDTFKVVEIQGQEPLTFEAWSAKNANTRGMQTQAV